MTLLSHLIYEYKKGVRPLFLLTLPVASVSECVTELRKRGINHLVAPVNGELCNVFFGCPEALEVVLCFNSASLSELSHEEDFMLGALLGYDLSEQCKRYLSRTQKWGKKPGYMRLSHGKPDSKKEEVYS